jgi:hypothetical protein
MDVNAKDVISPEIIDKLHAIQLTSDSTIKLDFHKIVELCLRSFKANKTFRETKNTSVIPQVEFEVRFLSKNKRSITKTHFDNVIKYLKCITRP